jgi:hypothetical protein
MAQRTLFVGGAPIRAKRDEPQDGQ